MSLLQQKIIKSTLVISVLLVTIMFLGGEPSSARGFYYICWLSLSAYLWGKREELHNSLLQSPLGAGVTFIGLGLGMILIEETLAGTAVNILFVQSASELGLLISQYIANNIFLLSGFIVAWYVLLARYTYSRTEVFILVGLFGLFAEKIFLHILTIPILGFPLILPTMFSYMGIIAPSLLSLPEFSTKKLPRITRYALGLIFPILVSIPLLYIHTKLAEAGLIDPTVLQR